MKRICKVCLTEKELEQFPKAAHGKNGRRNQCTECRKTYHRTNSKLYYLKTRTEKLEKVKAYAIANEETIRVRRKKYQSQEIVREKERLRSQRRRQDPTGNPHRAFLTRRYLARKLNAKGYCTKEQLRWRWEYYGNMCYICGVNAQQTDHVIPLAKGGTNWPANLKPICQPCNARKGAKWPYNPQPLQGV